MKSRESSVGNTEEFLDDRGHYGGITRRNLEEFPEVVKRNS